MSNFDKKYSLIEEQEKSTNSPLTPFEISMLKIIDEEKKETRLKKELLEKIKEILPIAGKSDELALYFYELYKANFRKDGQYGKITKDDFVNPRYTKEKFTRNSEAWERTIAMLPFRGSNLEGYWKKDGKGIPIYIIISYGWFPILIFRDGIWYEVTDRYSSSTGRQITHVSPNSWKRELRQETFLLTPNEMKEVLAGVTHKEIEKGKREKLESKKTELTKRATWKKIWDSGDFIIRYKITNVKIVGDHVYVDVDINDASLRGYPTYNYLTDEGHPLDKKRVEKNLSRVLLRKLISYAGKIGTWDEPHSYLIKFNFKHNKKTKNGTSKK